MGDNITPEQFIYNIVEQSGLFDRDFYNKENPDVANASIDSLTHYINWGWKEGRKPNPNYVAPQFSTCNICPLLYDSILQNKQEKNTTYANDIIFPNNTDYDLIVPLGDSCYASSHVRIAGLQNASYPFDWSSHEGYVPKLYKSNLDIYFLSVIDIIFNRFNNFFTQEDFVELDMSSGDSLHKTVINKKNGLHYTHDFSVDLSMDDAFAAVAEKYTRRANRLLDEIASANRIAFVWMQDLWQNIDVLKNTKTVDDSVLMFGHEILSKCFPGKKIDILVFYHDETKKENEISTSIIDNNIYKYTSNHKFLFNNIFSKQYNNFITKSIYNILSKLTLNGRKG